MIKPTIKIVCDEVEISDGYHTFTELYEHRIALWIALCKQFAYKEFGPRVVWRSRKHSNGVGIDGWFLLGLAIKPGAQITYHLPDKEWNNCGWADTLDMAPEFDGHTSNDVLTRLRLL